MAKSIHLPCKNKPLHTSECSECSQLEHRVEVVEDKLDTIQEGAEVNVQSDWNETDPTSDSYIQNKPSITPITVDSQMDSTSENPVQNRAIYNAFNALQSETTSIWDYIQNLSIPNIQHETFILLAGETEISSIVPYTADNIISVKVTIGDGISGVAAQGDWEITDDGTDYTLTCSIAEEESEDVRFDIWWKADERV